ncbi:glycosyltransferase [Patescibacteria group bacterium]|nr:glycosyltransferase [Patescibacteria group bacterium]
MNLVLALLLVSGFLGLLITLNQLWLLRRYLALVAIIATIIFVFFLLIIGNMFVFVDIICFLALYQSFNYFRIIKSKVQPEHLRRISQTTALRLLLAQLLITALGLSAKYAKLSISDPIIFGVSGCILGLIMVVSTMQSVVEANKRHTVKKLIDAELPTLTVCIPARNETDSLTACLNTLTANDYPKLEILVLDDHSTNRRTPEIIRSFAHDGVVFIPGSTFNNEWLAKNWAYEQLLEMSNGEVVLFCGADTRFSPDALKIFVSMLINDHKKMLCVMPRNDYVPWKFSWIQPLRYAWEISLPRRSLHRPSVLPTCWLARRKFLLESGSFKAVSRRISPESYFARLALKENGYGFLQYPELLSQKPYSEQLETVLRLRYPQLRRQPETVALLTLVETLGGLYLVASLITVMFDHSLVLLSLGLFGFILFGITFGQVFGLTYRRRMQLVYILWPIMLLIDIGLMHISMWKYEFGTVLWKGRSVSPMVMRHSAFEAPDEVFVHSSSENIH